LTTNPGSAGVFGRLFRTVSKIEPHEIKTTLAAFAFVFLLMGSYYILRPVRDAMASDWTDTEVSFLWNINFFISAGIVAVYGLAISKVKFRYVVPSVYLFFAGSFIAFYLGVAAFSDRDLIDKAFYVWVSVFSLFHVSVFWSFMADTFSKEQAKRVFAAIGAGASLGAIVGPAIPALFAEWLGVDTLMLIASVGLLSVVPLVFYIYHLKKAELGNYDVGADLSSAKMGGSWWKGFQAFVANPYLLGIGVFILLYVFIGSFVYFEQKNMLADYSRPERTEILASIDWLVNVLTFGVAFFATGRIVKRWGMPTTLALIPLCVVAGLLILAFAPVITVLLALQVARRSGNYAVTRPAREMLFTQVTQEERFKAKPVVDIVVYRGGDAVSGSLFAILTDGIGLGLAAVALVGAGVAAVWTWVAVLLGRRFEAGAEDEGRPQSQEA
jgi:AAA family ATP:ADP antiporter